MDEGEPNQKKRFPWIPFAVVLLLALALIAVIVPGLMRTRIGSGESSPISTLKTILNGMEQFKSAVCVDLNLNGTGEYGFLEEAGGEKPCRMVKDGAVSASGARLDASPYIPRVLGKTEAFADGRLFRSSKAGYHFILYLPAGPNSATSACGSEVDAALAESRFIAYAWPQQAGRSGIRTYVITNEGQPYAMQNTGAVPYSEDNAPPWDAALKDPYWDSPIDDGGPGRAGRQNWLPVG